MNNNGAGHSTNGDTHPSPPYSAEGEISVLGGTLIDPDAVDRARKYLQPSDFFRESHRRIWRTVCSLHDEGSVVDVITLSDRLRDRGDLEEAGGHSYLAELLDAVPTAANLEYHARIVHQKSQLRKLMEAGTEMVQLALHANGDDPAKIIEEAERKVYSIRQGTNVSDGYQAPDRAIWSAMELIEEEGKSKGGVTGIPTGFPSLDRMTTGLHPGDLTIIAGRPSMGKTALALRICGHAADTGAVVAISSLEMPEDQLMKRMLAMRGRVDLLKIRQGQMKREDYERLSEAASWVHGLPLRIDDRTGATVHEIRSEVRRLASREKVGLVMIDYLQLMDGQGDNRTQQIGDVAKKLKRLAREFDTHVLALSQLNRGVEHRSPPRPQMSDLRESGEIEEAADNVLMVWRNEYYFDDDTPDEIYAKWQGKGELIVAKQRNGPTGSVWLHWDAPTTVYTELQKEKKNGGPEAPW